MDWVGGWLAPHICQCHCRGWEAAHFAGASVLALPGGGVRAVGRGPGERMGAREKVPPGSQPHSAPPAVGLGAMSAQTKGGLFSLAQKGSMGRQWHSWGPEGRGGKDKVRNWKKSREDQESGRLAGSELPSGDAQETQGCHLPSMIVTGSPGSIRRAPGSVTSLIQCPSEGQACGDRKKGEVSKWPGSEV